MRCGGRFSSCRPLAGASSAADQCGPGRKGPWTPALRSRVRWAKHPCDWRQAPSRGLRAAPTRSRFTISTLRPHHGPTTPWSRAFVGQAGVCGCFSPPSGVPAHLNFLVLGGGAGWGTADGHKTTDLTGPPPRLVSPPPPRRAGAADAPTLSANRRTTSTDRDRRRGSHTRAPPTPPPPSTTSCGGRGCSQGAPRGRRSPPV